VSRLRGVLRRLLAARPRSTGPLDAVAGYDLWAPTYDDGDNLLVTLDEIVFGNLIGQIAMGGRRVLDVGCGTGRHWARILAMNPAALLGVDASTRMLDRLRAKHPRASLMRTEGYLLPGIPDRSVDVLVSTLALAHFADAEAALAEWSRTLRPGGDAIITDLHPEAVARGACTFEHESRTLTIRLYPRELAAIQDAAAQAGLETVRFEQRVIDEAVQPYFDGKGASPMFARLKGLPLIYGWHLRKRA
jgi:ubiquinone/menaquinone biosynthesis C-methylase UbiE